MYRSFDLMQWEIYFKEQAFTAAKVMIKEHVLKKSRESIPAICTKNWSGDMKNVKWGAEVEKLVNVVSLKKGFKYDKK